MKSKKKKKKTGFQEFATSFWKMKMEIWLLQTIRQANQVPFQNIVWNYAITNCLLKMFIKKTCQASEYFLPKTADYGYWMFAMMKISANI